MALFGRRQAAPAEEIEWDLLRPRRLRPHVHREADSGEQLVSVIVPRFRTRWLERLSDLMRLKPYRVHLDALGSAVWLQCDGQQTVSQIRQRLDQEFADQQMLDGRLQLFLGQLARSGFVELMRERIDTNSPSTRGEPG